MKKNLRNPVGVDLRQAGARVDTFLCLEGSDQDAIRAEEVGNSSSLCKELRVGEDVESAVWFGVGLEDSAHRLSGATWHSRFLDDNLGGSGNSRDAARGKLNIALNRKMG